MAKTYTTVPSVSTGDIYEASAYNTYTATNISNLIVPPMCKLTASTTQSVANSLDTLATLGTSEFDTDGMGTTGSSAKITINTAGMYLVAYSMTFASSAGGTGRFATITKNGVGSTVGGTGYGWNWRPPAGGVTGVVAGTVMLTLSASDYLSLMVWQDSGGALNISSLTAQSWLSAVWVGRTS